MSKFFSLEFECRRVGRSPRISGDDTWLELGCSIDISRMKLRKGCSSWDFPKLTVCGIESFQSFQEMGLIKLYNSFHEALTQTLWPRGCLASDWCRPQGVEWVEVDLKVYHSGRSDTGHIWPSPMRWWGVDSDSCYAVWLLLQNALEIWNDLKFLLLVLLVSTEVLQA